MPALTTTRPAAPFEDAKARVAAAVEAARDEIVDLSHRIHADPEPAFEETHAAAWVAESLARHGFEVEHPAGSLATAVRATLRGRAGDGPRIGILAEYDALPGLGHGCGHNTMAASGVGAAIALAALADELPGEIVFLGTPAEERGSGKQIMIDDGLFEGLDAALLYHPCDRNHVESYPLASEDVEVVFTGLQSHASSDPWRGKNALDAMIVLFTSVGLWRQQLHPTARVHGIIQEGGTAANIIPDRTSAWFMLRSADEATTARCGTGSAQMCEAAALATDTTVEVTFSGRRPDDAQQPRPGRAVPGQHGRLRHRRPGRRPQRRLDRHGQRELGLPDHPPRPGDRAGGHARPLDPVPRRGRHPARRRDDAAGRDARRPDRRRAVRGPGARGRRLGGVSPGARRGFLMLEFGRSGGTQTS